jgi:putative transposase
VTSNKPGFVPQLINGRPLKHLNAYYNKQRANHQSTLVKESRRTSRQLDRITTKRNRRINAYLHTASRRLIDQLVSEGIGTLVIGLNKQWKQEVNIGRHNNQTFCHIPHNRFIQMLEYKAQLVGIIVIVREESYTSQASFLDLDPIPSYDPKASEKPVFSGRRETRGLYRARGGRRVQADVNGSYNTLRKEFPHAFCESQVGSGQQIGGAAVHPRRMNGKCREDIGSSVSASRLNGCDGAFAIIS